MYESKRVFYFKMLHKRMSKLQRCGVWAPVVLFDWFPLRMDLMHNSVYSNVTFCRLFGCACVWVSEWVFSSSFYLAPLHQATNLWWESAQCCFAAEEKRTHTVSKEKTTHPLSCRKWAKGGKSLFALSNRRVMCKKENDMGLFSVRVKCMHNTD